MLSILHFDHFKKGIQTSTLRCIASSFRGRYRMWMCVIILPLKSFLLLRLWTRADCSHGCVLVSLVLVSFAICICMCRTRRRSLVITNLFATLPGCRFRIWFPKKTKQNAADFNCLTHLSAWAWQPGRTRKGMPEWDDATTGAETENSRTSWEHTLFVNSDSGSESATKISRYTSR